jgi:hypothetical protein
MERNMRVEEAYCKADNDIGSEQLYQMYGQPVHPQRGGKRPQTQQDWKVKKSQNQSHSFRKALERRRGKPNKIKHTS